MRKTEKTEDNTIGQYVILYDLSAEWIEDIIEYHYMTTFHRSRTLQTVMLACLIESPAGTPPGDFFSFSQAKTSFLRRGMYGTSSCASEGCFWRHDVKVVKVGMLILHGPLILWNHSEVLL